MKWHLFVAGLVLAASGGRTAPSLAEPNSPLAATIDSALTSLYNLDHAKAQSEFRSLANQDPDDPIRSYGLATAWWWELTNEFDEHNSVLDKSLLHTSHIT